MDELRVIGDYIFIGGLCIGRLYPSQTRERECFIANLDGRQVNDIDFMAIALEEHDEYEAENERLNYEVLEYIDALNTFKFELKAIIENSLRTLAADLLPRLQAVIPLTPEPGEKGQQYAEDKKEAKRNSDDSG